MTQRLVQAYRQAPWRSQVQGIVIFLVGLAIVALVALLYRSISAQTAAAGVTIQDLEATRDDLERQIEDLKTQNAFLTSTTEMEKRARDLGFQEIDPQKIMYIVVAGYPGRQTASLAPSTNLSVSQRTLIKPVYTESLWEWLFQGALNVSENMGGAAQ